MPSFTSPGRFAWPAANAYTARKEFPGEGVALANKAGGIVVGKFGTAAVSYVELFGA